MIIGKLYGSNVGTSNAIRNIDDASKLIKGKISSNVNRNLNRAIKTLKSGRRSSSYYGSSSRYSNNNRNYTRLLGLTKTRAPAAAGVAGVAGGPPVSITISNIGKVSNSGKSSVSNVGKLSNAGKTSNAGSSRSGGSNAGGGGGSYGSNAGGGGGSYGSNAGGGGGSYGSNAGGSLGGLGVSAPSSSGTRTLAASSEQLIRGAGGAEAVEQGIKALKAANGNVNKAKATSRLPNKTFTNIYAMGGPVAAKRLVEKRRRRLRAVGGRRVGTGTRGAPGKKKRVARKPKQYIKLTPYQFRRLTDHIKKNNLRKVLIKEITH